MQIRLDEMSWVMITCAQRPWNGKWGFGSGNYWKSVGDVKVLLGLGISSVEADGSDVSDPMFGSDVLFVLRGKQVFLLSSAVARQPFLLSECSCSLQIWSRCLELSLISPGSHSNARRRIGDQARISKQMFRSPIDSRLTESQTWSSLVSLQIRKFKPGLRY